MRGDQISRQWHLLRALAGRPTGAPARELARELVVSVRTVYRDLEILERVGIPLVQERDGRQVCWRLLEPRNVRLGPAFNVDELAALHHARECLRENGNAKHVPSIESLLAKIEALVPRRMVERLPELLDATPGGADGGDHGDHGDR